MDAATYNEWYSTPRGQWIGEREAGLILEHLRPRPGESLLDVGCGTGYFTRSMADSIDGPVTGADINPKWVAYARGRDAGQTHYEVADARALPYDDASFDLVISIAAVCFIEQQMAATREILRVARRRFAIGFLNRHSLLWMQKGRGGGRGGYHGAHWHTVREAKQLFRELPVQHLEVYTAIQIPTGGKIARFIERALPTSLPLGGFILVVGDAATPMAGT
ncbi:Malonyl-[acyl-carrier protein] O-methyltransferase [Planctomycetes bacterium CA13]|uniref:Malonyl-[acyl-carrier protein] O-methyltransferase n=1 Tax=Novipirellula herctigrandis TaxID=2527986 RepID=A0A5C5YZ93_9BACT|nr:Malonyl-[acyl-carrier protein] O-methyltransferase [Planctomycetes bacterium CA13]